MVLHILIPVGSTQVHHSHIVGFIHKFVKRSAVPSVELVIDSRANIFGASYEVDYSYFYFIIT